MSDMAHANPQEIGGGIPSPGDYLAAGAANIETHDYAGPNRRTGDMASMGLEGRAKLLGNVAAVALVAAIACLLLGVVLAVMWAAMRNSDRRTDAMIAAQEQAFLAQAKLAEAHQRREDDIRDQERKRAEQLMARFDMMTAKLDSMTSALNTMTAEVRASRVRIESAERTITGAKEAPKP